MGTHVQVLEITTSETALSVDAGCLSAGMLSGSHDRCMMLIC